MTKRRRPAAARKVADARFWGRPADGWGGPADGIGRPADGIAGDGQADQAEPAAKHPAPDLIRPTPDPAAVVRSLGVTPLALDQSVAERHLTAVYEEAVRTAAALAAANGLLAPEAEDQD